MAFGKIIVLTASGDAEEYELTKPTTSVGRQPGNDIVLQTSAVSRYHAQLNVAEGGIFLVDLGTVNGTFVNDVQVEPNGRVALNDEDVIMLGDVVMRFQSPGARSGLKRAALSFTPEAVPIEQAGLPFRIVLDEPQQSVAPGARLQLSLVIENLSERTQTLDIDIGGLDPDWIKASRRDVALEPYESAQATISVRPPRSSQTRPGVYALTVRVSLQDDANAALQAVREIDVVGYSGLGIAVKGGRSDGQFHLAVQNQGNVPGEIQLSGFQREGLLRYRFNPSRLKLRPGETRQVALSVQPAKGRAFGATRDVEFAIVAQSLDAAGFQAPVATRYSIRPSWPRWLIGAGLPLLFGAVVVLAVVAAALVYVGIVPWPFGANPFAPPVEITTVVQPTVSDALQPSGPTPTIVPTVLAAIDSFTATPVEVFYATEGTVTLAWQVWGAQDTDLFGPDGAPITLSEENLGSGQLDVAISSLRYGENTFTLTITGADAQPRTRTVLILAKAAVCTVEDAITVLTAPDEDAPGASVRISPQVLVTGRTEDSAWARIGYNDLTTLAEQGWVPADEVDCPPEAPPLEQYVVIPEGASGPTGPQPPGPRAPQTPAAATATPKP